MYRNRSGPSPLLIIIVGALFVFGGYYVWIGFLSFLEDQGDITADVTRQAVSTTTAESQSSAPLLPTVFQPATFTPLPPCQTFVVSVERAVYRECPSQNNQECPIREVIPQGTELCVYAPVPNNAEWYVIELNPGGAYRDIVYMHQSVIEAKNPTTTPSPSFTPLPTVSPVPTDTPAPTAIPTLTPTPDTQVSPTPSPTLTPSGTPPQITI